MFTEKLYKELFEYTNLDKEQIEKLQYILKKMIEIAVKKENKAQTISNNRRSDPDNYHPENYDIPYFAGKIDVLNAAFHAITGTLEDHDDFEK